MKLQYANRIFFILVFITLTSAFNPINRNAPPKLLDFVQSDFLNQVLSMSKSSGQNLCPMCKNVMTTLKSSLSNPTIKTDVTSLMSQLCTKMVDNSYQRMCNLFVSSHLPSLLNSIVDSVNPEAFCEDTFEVCQSTSPANRKYRSILSQTCRQQLQAKKHATFSVSAK